MDVISYAKAQQAETNRRASTPGVVSGSWVRNMLQLPLSNAFHEETTRGRLKIMEECHGLRLVYGYTEPDAAAERQVATPFNIKASIKYENKLYLVTFGGKEAAELQPPGGVVVSDPVGIDIYEPEYIYVTTYCWVPFGAPTTTTAEIKVNDTTMSLTAKPNISSGYVQLDGANPEVVYIEKIEGAGPYTATLKSGTKFAASHASGVHVGQYLPQNLYVHKDLEEGTLYTGDYTNNINAVLTAANVTSNTVGPGGCAEGATVLPLASSTQIRSSKIIINKGEGTEEEVTVVAYMSSGGTQWRAILSTPTAHAHLATEPVVGTIGYEKGMAPLFVLAEKRPKPKKTVIVCGDSIASGSEYLLRQPSVGWHTIALERDNIPFIGQGIVGQTLTANAAQSCWLTLSKSVLRRGYWKYGDWVLMELGSNDFFGYGLTAAEVKAAVAKIVKQIHGCGMKVCLTTITPRTTSTDFWATTGNQTKVSAPDDEQRVAYNKWVREGAEGLADATFDMTAPVESSENSGLWLPGTSTSEGVHPAAPGHEAIAAALNAAELFV